VLVECLVASSKHPLGHFSTPVNVMGSINEDLWLHNGDKPILLADNGISCQALGIEINRELRGLICADLEDSTPLGKAGTSFIVLGAPLAKVIMALGGGLTIGASKLNGALVNLDARKDSSLLEDIHKGLSSSSLLVEGLLKEDDTTQVLQAAGGAEEELTKITAVFLNVLNVNACQTLANGASRFISSKNTLAWGANVGSIGNELICSTIKVETF